LLLQASAMIDWAHLTALDWVIVVVLALSTLLSLWRGFAREAISLAGWVAAFLIANLLADQLASMMVDVISNETGRYVAAFAILFAVTLMVASVLGIFAAKLISVTGLSILDRLLGTVFGVTRGIILVLVCVFVLRKLVPPQDLQWLQQSQLMPHLDILGQWAQDMFARANDGQPPAVAT
jgi:membrane protein required for colicin V production